ncbi:GD12015 [Drosophila simulans]|uniref:GD12015 n=1 Tax=Drosophila simulans TaxID=7240 RepID=B4NRW5_DROSI|nr:GD12015 [Drosophila simulans]
MGGWIGAGDATDETADQAQCKKVKGRRPQESPSKSAYIVRWLLDKDRDTRTQGRRKQDQDGKPQHAARQDSRKRFHI